MINKTSGAQYDSNLIALADGRSGGGLKSTAEPKAGRLVAIELGLPRLTSRGSRVDR